VTCGANVEEFFEVRSYIINYSFVMFFFLVLPVGGLLWHATSASVVIHGQYDLEFAASATLGTRAGLSLSGVACPRAGYSHDYVLDYALCRGRIPYINSIRTYLLTYLLTIYCRLRGFFTTTVLGIYTYYCVCG
jgi:hypothetical protein